MSSYESYEANQPVMWINGRAIYTAHFIMLVYVASMVITALFGNPMQSIWGRALVYHSDLVLQGEVWRVLSYAFVNPPSLWFVIDMFMLVFFGMELEKIYGRKKFLVLFGSLYLLTPLLFTLIGNWLPLFRMGQAGSFGLFIVFATLYPGVAFMFGILAKWLAYIFVSIYTLIHLADRNWAELISLWATVGFAYGFVRYEQGFISLPRLKLFQRKPKLRVIEGGKGKVESAPVEVLDSTVPVSEMDALLDKIAHSGIGSLTAKERARLEQSRAELLKRQGRS